LSSGRKKNIGKNQFDHQPAFFIPYASVAPIQHIAPIPPSNPHPIRHYISQSAFAHPLLLFYLILAHQTASIRKIVLDAPSNACILVLLNENGTIPVLLFGYNTF
jgi:hypothetical protein